MNKVNIRSNIIILVSCLDLSNHFTFPLLGILLLSNHPSLQKQKKILSLLIDTKNYSYKSQFGPPTLKKSSKAVTREIELGNKSVPY